MKHKLISIRNQQEWETAVSKLPHTYTHTHWYNYAMHIASNRDIFLYAGESHNFRIICPLSLRKKEKDDAYDITTPYGFSGFASAGHYQEFNQEWCAFLKENGFVCGHIALHPLHEQDVFFKTPDIYLGKTAYCLQLTESLDEIRAKFSSDHKHRLRQWQKNNFELIISKDDERRLEFIKLYAHFLQEKKAADVYHFGEKAWNQLLDSPYTHLVAVIENNEMTAASIFIQYHDIIDYFLSACTIDGRKHARGIIWEGIKLGKAKGCSWLHLGCGVNENDHLQKFKEHFGGKGIVTKALKQIYHLDQYHQLCAKYQSDANDINGYFPSYWRKNYA